MNNDERDDGKDDDSKDAKAVERGAGCVDCHLACFGTLCEEYWVDHFDQTQSLVSELIVGKRKGSSRHAKRLRWEISKEGLNV